MAKSREASLHPHSLFFFFSLSSPIYLYLYLYFVWNQKCHTQKVRCLQNSLNHCQSVVHAARAPVQFSNMWVGEADNFSIVIFNHCIYIRIEEVNNGKKGDARHYRNQKEREKKKSGEREESSTKITYLFHGPIWNASAFN